MNEVVGTRQPQGFCMTCSETRGGRSQCVFYIFIDFPCGFLNCSLPPPPPPQWTLLTPAVSAEQGESLSENLSQNRFICERPITSRWQPPAAQPARSPARPVPCPERPSPVVLQCGGVGTFSGHLPRQRKELHPSEQECVVTHAELGRRFIDDQLEEGEKKNHSGNEGMNTYAVCCLYLLSKFLYS